MRKPHGTRGELRIHPLTDHPGRTFAPGVVLFPAGPDDRSPDYDLPPLRVEEARPVPRGWLVLFGGVEDRSTAALLRGRYLLRPIEEIEESADDELFYHELLTLRVEDREGELLGRVVEVYEVEPADLLEVHGPGGTFLLPFTREIVVSVDREEGVLVIDPPDGLLDLR